MYNDRRRLYILSPVNRDPVERDHTTSTVHTHTPLDIILHCESWRLGKLTEAHHHQNKKQTSIGESIKRGQIDQKKEGNSREAKNQMQISYSPQHVDRPSST